MGQKSKTPQPKKGAVATSKAPTSAPPSIKTRKASAKNPQAPVVKKTPTPVVKKVQTPVVKKVQTPAVKKVQTPAVKKSQTPVMKKMQTPVVKKAQTPANKSPGPKKVRTSAKMVFEEESFESGSGSEEDEDISDEDGLMDALKAKLKNKHTNGQVEEDSEGASSDGSEFDEDDMEDDQDEPMNTSSDDFIANEAEEVEEGDETDSDIFDGDVSDDEGGDDSDDDGEQEIKLKPQVLDTVLKRAAESSQDEESVPAKKQKKLQQQEGIQLSDKESEEQKARMELRDRKTLFVKNVPDMVGASAVRSLSADIKDVRMRKAYKKGKSRGYAYVEFENEKIAEKNYKKLQGVKLEGKELLVDYVGSKSAFKKDSAIAAPEVVNPKKLYVTGFGTDITVKELSKLFSTAADITLPMRRKTSKPLGYAFIEYASEGKAKEAHEKMELKQFKGATLIVLFSKSNSKKEKMHKIMVEKSKQPGKESKKAKQAKKPKAKTQAKKEPSSDEDNSDDE